MPIGKLIIKALDILNDVPVIGFFSRAGGFVVGIIKGICVLWIIGIVITFFSCKPEAVEFMTKLQSSFIAGWIYDNNILLSITDICLKILIFLKFSVDNIDSA